jgi:WD40 repeat protein
MNHLLISTLNNQIQVLDLNKDEEVIKFSGHVNSNFLVDLQVYENDNNVYLISGSEDGYLYLWNVEGQNLEPKKFQVEESTCTINCITMNKSGILATAGFNCNENIRFFKMG